MSRMSQFSSPFLLGFDEIEQVLDRLTKTSGDGYPPYNIERIAREGGGRMMRISAGLLVGGALGNVVDRVLYGAVADFLNVSCCGIENPYAFNVADIAIFAGAVGLVLFGGDKRSDGQSPGPQAGRGGRRKRGTKSP